LITDVAAMPTSFAEARFSVFTRSNAAFDGVILLAQHTHVHVHAQVLFPYAAERLQSHLEATFGSADTQKDVQLFREQVGVQFSIFGTDGINHHPVTPCPRAVVGAEEAGSAMQLWLA